jgi:uncharacterized protein DUF955
MPSPEAEAARLLGYARRVVPPALMDSLPIDVEGIARVLGVSSIEPRALQADGYLGRDSLGRLVIRYRASQSRTAHRRIRFTIAHEVGHLLMGLSRGREVERSERGGTSEQWEETVVNCFAARLLVPDTVVRSRIAGCTPSWAILRSMSDDTKVSLLACARRILELPGYVGTFIRLSKVGEGLSYRTEVGNTPRTLFVEYPGALVLTIHEEARRSSRHPVKVEAGGRVHDLLCQGSRVTGGENPEYWVTGWAAL